MDFIIRLIQLNISSTILGCIAISKMFKLSMTTHITRPCEVVLGTRRRVSSVQQAQVPRCKARQPGFAAQDLHSGTR